MNLNKNPLGSKTKEEVKEKFRLINKDLVYLMNNVDSNINHLRDEYATQFNKTVILSKFTELKNEKRKFDENFKCVTLNNHDDLRVQYQNIKEFKECCDANIEIILDSLVVLETEIRNNIWIYDNNFKNYITENVIYFNNFKNRLDSNFIYIENISLQETSYNMLLSHKKNIGNLAFISMILIILVLSMIIYHFVFDNLKAKKSKKD